MNEIITAIVAYYGSFWGGVELVGSIASLICVYLALKHNQLTWLFGAIGVLLFGALFVEFKLYSDAGLQILFFLPVQIWGYFTWKSLAETSNLKSVTRSLKGSSIPIIGVAIGVCAFINGYVMDNYTDAAFPYVDALTTWMSIFAQVLMVKKFWESWALWVGMDVIAIYVYFAKGLFVVSGVYAIFLVVAIFGGIAWYRDYKSQQEMVA